MVYIPRDFIPHAASLRQTFVHCGIFVTAASRRSLASVSVPMCRADLSAPVPVAALVGRYLTNKLIGHRPRPGQQVPKDPRLLAVSSCDKTASSGITHSFPWLSLYPRYVTHVFLTLPPLYYPSCPGIPVRLACFSHAASVRSEPGSNSSLDFRSIPFRGPRSNLNSVGRTL